MEEGEGGMEREREEGGLLSSANKCQVLKNRRAAEMNGSDENTGEVLSQGKEVK